MLEVVDRNDEVITYVSGEQKYVQQGAFVSFAKERVNMAGLIYSGALMTEAQLLDLGIWRADAVSDVFNLLDSNEVVLVKGIPESGKGAVLRGTTLLARELGIPFCLFDMHRLRSPIRGMEDLIYKLEQSGGIVLLDSADYLYGNRGIRKTNILQHFQRSRQVLILIERIAALPNVKLIISVHDEGTWHTNLEPELKEEFEDSLSRTNSVEYALSPFFREISEWEYFMSKGPLPLPVDLIEFMRGLIVNGVSDYEELVLTDGNSTYTNSSFFSDGSLSRILMAYPVMKKLALPVDSYLPIRDELLEKWDQFKRGYVTKIGFLSFLCRFCRESYYYSLFREMLPKKS